MFEPLKITAYLQSGVISDPAMPLEGVLLYQLFRERRGGISEATMPGDVVYRRTNNMRLPLLRHRDRKPDWFYACSFARWSVPRVDGSDHWNKRFDQSLVHLVDFQGKRGRIETSSGRFKPYHMPVFYIHALRVTWFAVGERRPLERLLSFCTNIGKKTSQGWGAVLRWEVELWHSDWSVESPMGIMRPVPTEGGIVQGFRPPYWVAKNQAPCVAPGSYDFG